VRSPAVASPLVVVPPPATPIYRVAHGADVFRAPNWNHADEDGTFGNRFDDPGGQPDLCGRRGILPTAQRFRTIYCATDRAGAFGETVARFRPSPKLYLGLQDIDDDEPIDPSLAGGVVPVHWRMQRLLGIARLDQRLRFVDVAAPETHDHLNWALADVLTALGIDGGFDLSSITSRHRRLSQEVARYVYEFQDEAGEPLYAGIRYLSRLNAGWECWAVFDTRFEGTSYPAESIFPDDPGLREACARLGLRPPQPF
jgi:hypothetical protein